MENRVIEDIRKIAGENNTFESEIMAPHMSMKVGGAADCFVTPDSIEKISELIRYLNENAVPYYVIGNGSNVIIRDCGFRGVIVNIKDKMKHVSVLEDKVTAGAGISLREFAQFCLERSLAGFEFASGIPGSLGGAVCMNAGAYDGEMKDVVTLVRAIDRQGKLHAFSTEECDFSYRHSIFSNGDYVIVEAEIKLSDGEENAIRERMEDLDNRRSDKQPLEFPSCGSTFKRPEGYYAGKLIMDAGLKGARVGGASVSEKHCGFVINDREGSAEDVLGVIELVQKTVKERFGVELECEVKVL